MSLFCDSSQKERIKKAGEETQENNSHVAMLLFVFTVSIPNSKPMPQVQITESVSRANNDTQSPFPLLCFACCGNGQRTCSTRGLIVLTSLKQETIENSYPQIFSFKKQLSTKPQYKT
jgi:hypothetical protein